LGHDAHAALALLGILVQLGFARGLRTILCPDLCRPLRSAFGRAGGIEKAPGRLLFLLVLGPGFRPLRQDSGYGWANCLVRTVDAAHPATGSTNTLFELAYDSTNMFVASFLLLWCDGPTNPLVAGEGCEAFPKCNCGWSGAECLFEVVWQFVDGAAGELGWCHRRMVPEVGV
jgi:hypothetical protein